MVEIKFLSNLKMQHIINLYVRNSREKHTIASSILKKATWQGLFSKLAKQMKASATSMFNNKTAAMKDIPCTWKYKKQKPWKLTTIYLWKRYETILRRNFKSVVYLWIEKDSSKFFFTSSKIVLYLLKFFKIKWYNDKYPV